MLLNTQRIKYGIPTNTNNHVTNHTNRFLKIAYKTRGDIICTHHYQ